MLIQPPKIDPRSADDIARNVRELLKAYAPEWDAAKSDKGDPLAAALIAVFARYAEIVIDRLNQTPRKNFLAFLDLLGASLQPPQSARVPLTFSLAEGSPANGVVPRGAQVAAAPAEGEENPVAFETDRELVVTTAQLDSVFVIEPAMDRFSDRSAVITPITEPAANGYSLFEAETPIDHFLYIGDREIFGLPNLKNVKLTLGFVSIPADQMTIKWDRWNGEEWEAVASSTIGAGDPQQIADFGALQPIPLSMVSGLENRWMRGRLETPITLSDAQQTGYVRASQLPTLQSLTLTAETGGAVSVEQSFADQIPIDASKEFFPFGQKPGLGATWLVSQSDAFSQLSARIVINLTITGAVKASVGLALKWEVWNGEAWEELKSAPGEPQDGELRDNTKNLTASGDVILRLRAPAAIREINGVQGRWLRARIVGGNYGEEFQYALKTPGKPEDGYILTPATFAPPLISSVKISYEVRRGAAPQMSLASNNFDLRMVLPDPDLQPGFDGELPQTSIPFQPASATAFSSSPAFYLGFLLPAGRGFSQSAVSLYFSLRTPMFGEAAPQADKRPEIVWERWNGRQWNRLVVSDETSALTRTGQIDFLPPSDIAQKSEFGRLRYWLRARWAEGQYPFIPRANRILLNTTMASQGVTLWNEVLGSSDGGKNQIFRAASAPILNGQRLEVRELELPSAAEQEAIRIEEGEDAITVIPETGGQGREIWVSWRQTPDFYSSGPRDRHYMLDHLTGEIRFGDGLIGMIPPAGAGNIRLAQYRTGGGRAGNRPAGSIVQLKTAVPYVDGVTNHEPSTGGADIESVDSLIDRAPRAIRHNNRAVTMEDFEDMAMLASPEVARAKCAPLRNLAIDPLDQNTPIDPLTGLPGLRGHVSVIIVPCSDRPRPSPSLELVKRAQAFLEANSAPTASISVVGPLYLRVDVEAEIALASLEGAGEVELAVLQKLDAFLHPLTGGSDDKGWDFGREPHLSDLYALLESIAGVDHVIQLRLTETVDASDLEWLGLDAVAAVDAVKKTGRFLVYSGARKISLIFEG
jgi:hypothetical protein